MFKENIAPNKKTSPDKIMLENNNEDNKVLEGFSSWKEKNSYVAQKLVEEKSEDILSYTDNLVDDQGRFLNFLNPKSVKHISKIFRELAAGKKVQGGLYDPKYNSTFGKEAIFDADFGRVLVEALPVIFNNKINSGEHNNNLAIIQAWAQTEKYLTYEEDRMSNEAHIKESFKSSLDSDKISVLEEIYINYLGRLFNQSDAEDLKSFLPEIYERFKNKQPDIERYRKEVPSNLNITLSSSARRVLLQEKFELFAFSYPEPNLIDDAYIENKFFRSIKQHETGKGYVVNDENHEEYLKELRENKNVPLRPCRKEINPMELNQSDGEYLIADFSQDYYGIYTVSGSLEAYIKKSDLKTTNKPVEAQDFSSVKNEVNFYNNQDIASFKVMSSLFFRDALEKKCGIDIASLNLRTQYQFLNFISSYSEDKFLELKEFMDKGNSLEARSNRLKSFLCLELDEIIGVQIIALGKKFNTETAELFFSKMAEINDLASKEDSELRFLLLKDNKHQDLSGLKADLLRKALELVMKVSIISVGILNEEKSEYIFSELEKIKTEVALLSGLLKSAKESGQNIPLEMIKDLDLEKRVINSKKGVDLSKEEKTQLIKIARENYQAIFLQKGENYNPEAYQRIIAHYEKDLEDLEGQSVYILKYKNEIVCSSRFEKISEYAVYGGAFNVSGEVQGLSLGGSFIEKVLEEVSKDYDVHISTRKDNPANNSYQRAGFVVTGEYKEEDGVEYYKMIKPAKSEISLERAA